MSEAQSFTGNFSHTSLPLVTMALVPLKNLLCLKSPDTGIGLPITVPISYPSFLSEGKLTENI